MSSKNHWLLLHTNQICPGEVGGGWYFLGGGKIIVRHLFGHKKFFKIGKISKLLSLTKA